jgi:hypothetical protein
MQETRINKVSRRFYIDHADDHAVVRAVPVHLERKPKPEIVAPAAQPAVTPAKHRGKLPLVRLPLRKHG